MPTLSPEPQAHSDWWEKDVLGLGVRVDLLQSLVRWVSSCFPRAVREDVRRGVSVPQGGLHGREQAGAEQRLLRRQQTAPRD